MRIKSVKELEEASIKFHEKLDLQEIKVLVCGGTGCVASGSIEIYERLIELVKNKGLLAYVRLEEEKKGIGIKKSGCHGFCEMGPLVRIEPFNYLYIGVKVEDCEEIVEETLINKKPITRLMYRCSTLTEEVKEIKFSKAKSPIELTEKIYETQESIPFYKKQTRMVLEHCGSIDAEAIEEYIAKGGYKALAKALTKMTPDEICKDIIASNLRGRGGGGYPAGRKWAQVLAQKSETKYVVCNGDEGDPGAFMDRSLMEGDPHRLIEGMMIAGYATGSSEGYIYVRAEYPLAVERINTAIEKARSFGILGKNILDSGFDFDIHVNQGAGAFVCGEGSALTASIEGERGMPRVKPPRTVEAGLWAKPTVLNNVETFANVPLIISKGSTWFKSIGPEKSPGTKAFAITGNVNNTGLIEVPMGTSLREVIFGIGGGIKGDKKFKAVQIGGPSGGCLVEEHLDMPLDFDSLKKVGAMIGSGGLVVMDEDTCMVEVARFFMNFTQNESCGKCVPCREGTKRMLEIMENIVSGKGTLEDLDLLEELADTVSSTALCGLGKTAAGPVISTMKYFKDEYIEHVVNKRCSTKTCKGLTSFTIDGNLCKGCSKCQRVCPAGAIQGKIKETFRIIGDRCIKCGACIDACPFKAIKEV